MHYEKALEFLRQNVLTADRKKFQCATPKQMQAYEQAFRVGGSAGAYFIDEQAQLTALNLSYERPSIKNLSALSQIDSLRILSLRLRIPEMQHLLPQLNDLTQLQALQLLIDFNYDYDDLIFSLDVVSKLVDMRRFSCIDGRISSLSGIAAWKELEWLELSSNHIEDLSPLAGLAKIELLYLEDNRINDTSIFAQRAALPSTLWLRGNPLRCCPPLQLIARNGDGLNPADMAALYQTQTADLAKIWALFLTKQDDNMELGKTLLLGLGWSPAWAEAFRDTSYWARGEERECGV